MYYKYNLYMGVAIDYYRIKDNVMFEKNNYIYEIFKERSFSKAAQKLYISQPALSAFVRKEEKDIGMSIFDRSTKPIKLTECGEQYIAAIEKIQDAESAFYNYLHSLSNLQKGKISIGGSNLFTSLILPGILVEFQNRYPNIQVIVLEASSKDLKQKLIEGTLDFVVEDNMFESSVFKKKLYLKEHLLFAVPKCLSVNNKLKKYQLSSNDIINDKHLSTSIPNVPASNFNNCPFILLNEGNESRSRANIIFNKERMRPQNTINVEQQFTAYLMTCQGIGISIICDTTIKWQGENNDIWFYKIESDNSIMELSFYFKKNRYMTKSMGAFLDVAGVS